MHNYFHCCVRTSRCVLTVALVILEIAIAQYSGKSMVNDDLNKVLVLE